MAKRKGLFGRIGDALGFTPGSREAAAVQVQGNMFAHSYNAGYSLGDEVSPLTGKRKPYDFSTESLAEVDRLIDELFHESDAMEPQDTDLFVSGASAYYGEVIRRSLGGDWKVGAPEGGQAAEPQGSGGPRLTGIGEAGLTELPFERVAHRVQSGDATALTTAYQELASRSPEQG